MKKRQVQIVILCEDSKHYSFLRRYLSERGYPLGKLRIPAYPAGRGSGKQFVRNRYVQEVCALRRKGQTHALVIMIDQDTPTQPDAYDDLNGRLAAGGLSRREPREHIAIFAPRYSIETWAYHLLDTDRPANETDNYKFRIDNDDCRQAGAEFVAYNPAHSPLPSLSQGCEERARIPSG